MAKKAIHIIFIVILLVSTVGIRISKHYSGGKLFSIALFGDAMSCCDTPCDCCSDETIFYHLDVDLLQMPSTQVEDAVEIDLFLPHTILYAVLFVKENKVSPINHIDDTSPMSSFQKFAFLQAFRC